ncbi:MAG: alpha amylase C-terminal domain-containing protein, partial [Acidimicrobiia bacterium]|nr:alpha amylase C-terminal domain-containing protein [Acidimicrobiia bacterium]
TDAARVLAFARGAPAEVVVVATRPGPRATVAADAVVALPAGRWTDLVTGDAVVGTLELGGRVLPLAVLERDR